MKRLFVLIMILVGILVFVSCEIFDASTDSQNGNFENSDNKSDVEATSDDTSENETTTRKAPSDADDLYVVDIKNTHSYEEDGPLSPAFEAFYDDVEYVYSFSYTYLIEHIIVTYNDGSSENISEALRAGRATISDLDRFGIHYYKDSKKNVGRNVLAYAPYGLYDVLKADAYNSNELGEENNLPLFILNSRNEVEEFIQKYGGESGFTEGYDDVLSFRDLIDEYYDEDYFENLSLVVVYIEVDSSSPRYYDYITTTDGVYCFNVTKVYDPIEQNNDPCGWFIISVISKSRTLRDFDNFNAKYVAPEG